MSKFFDQTLKVPNQEPPRGSAESTEFPKLVSAISGSPPEHDPGSARLKDCRKSRLPQSSDLPLLYEGNDFGEFAMEAYRALRTRLMRLTATQGLRSVMITSANQAEGKTLTCFNLALCCAQLSGLRVLVVDGDLRVRGLTRILNYPGGPGLAEVLAGQAEPAKAILATDKPNLFVLPAGSASVASPELFAGGRWEALMRWCSESFRLIIVDSPPIFPFTDAELIGSPCDGVLVVVRARRTNRDTLQKAASQVDSKKLLGVVFNGLNNGHPRPGYRQYLRDPKGQGEKPE